ncbi:MAG: hypothetical protein IBJ11_00565 [Phycisphaerales bacterium]|nr:hypothetical protein [Phycisphaerales bacterium]
MPPIAGTTESALKLRPAEPRPDQSGSDFDALAELFLGGAEPSPPAIAPKPPASGFRLGLAGAAGAGGHAEADGPDAPLTSPAAPAIDAVIMGHLPVRSAPWASQYAREIAERQGRPVALARLTGDTLSIDLFGISLTDRDNHDQPSIDEAIRHAAARAGSWIVSVSDVDEPALAGEASVSSLTLLAAGNEAAMVAAYQTIKTISGGRTRASHKPPIRLALMGVDESQADVVAAKLREAATVFLRERVELAAVVGRIRPTGGASVYRGTAELTLADLIAAIVRASSVRPAGTPPPAKPAGPAAGTGDGSAPAAATSSINLLDPEPALPSRPPVPPVSVTPAPKATASRPTVAAPEHGSLVPHTPGLHRLPLRCVVDASVEIAADHHGRLHLLRRDEDGLGLMRLTAALAWAQNHAELLALAARTPWPLDPSARPVVHLFTAAPKAVRPLLDADVRVHLLAAVEVDGKTGWYCTELN